MKFDMDMLGNGIAKMVSDCVEKSFNKLNADLENIVKRIDEIKLQKGEKGEDGKSVTIDDVKPLIQEEIKQAVSQIPTPKDGVDGEKGIDGKDGKDADIDLVVDKLYFKLFSSDEFTQRIIKLIPVPKDGKDGVNGKDASEDAIAERVLANLVIPKGEKGDKGEDATIDYSQLAKSIDADNIASLIAKNLDLTPFVKEQLEIMKSSIVDNVLKSIPMPENGKDGKDGVNGVSVDKEQIITEVLKSIPIPKDGVDGKSIDKDEVIEEILKAIPTPKDGLNGKDGTSVSIDDLKPFLDASMAKWQLEFERNAYDTLQKTVAMFPKPEKGEKGEDGFGIDTFEQVDDRTVKATFKRGDEVIEKEFKFPAVIYKGVYQKGFWEKGDAVTYAGSLWIAMKDTEATPSQSEDWKLSVKRGANGKDADKA